MVGTTLPLALTASPTPSPAPQPSAQGATPPDPGRFARELSRHTQERAPQADTPKHDAAESPDNQEEAPEQAAAQGNAAPAHQLPRERARGTDKPNAKGKPKEGARAEAADGEPQEAAAPAKASDPAADLNAWLAALNQQTQPAATSAGATAELGRAQGKDAGTDLAAAANAQNALPADANAALANAADAKDLRGHADHHAAGGEFDTLLAASARDALSPASRDKAERPASLSRDDALNMLSPGASPTAPSTAGAASASEAAVPGANIQAPLHSDEFAPALATQVSILARDGVQEAQLHLNPAEMGPIAVRIAVEDAQARVDFTAEQAATRSAIEASLPDLAAALRDAGLTLAGGGVFQQSAQQQQQQAQRGDAQGARIGAAAGSRSGGEQAASAAPVRRQVRAGGVDLYA
jgi:flagellar hook-length control protein FliK